MTIKITLEIGHEAAIRTKRTPEGFTHDWEVFVRGCDNANIHYYIEKVVFNLHETFQKPKRVVKEPPFSVKESGYAGFVLPIDIHLRNKDEPKKISFNYDLNLQNTGPAICKLQKEKFVFANPNDEFRHKLLKGGGVVVNSNNSLEDNNGHEKGLHNEEKNQLLSKPKLSSGDLIPRKHKPKLDEPRISNSFQELFGTPITKTTPTTTSSKNFAEIKLNPDVKNPSATSSSSKYEKEKNKRHSSHKSKEKEKDKDGGNKSKDKQQKVEGDRKTSKSRDEKKERREKEEKSGRDKKDYSRRSPSPTPRNIENRRQQDEEKRMTINSVKEKEKKLERIEQQNNKKKEKYDKKQEKQQQQQQQFVKNNIETKENKAMNREKEKKDSKNVERKEKVRENVVEKEKTEEKKQHKHKKKDRDKKEKDNAKRKEEEKAKKTKSPEIKREQINSDSSVSSPVSVHEDNVVLAPQQPPPPPEPPAPIPDVKSSTPPVTVKHKKEKKERKSKGEKDGKKLKRKLDGRSEIEPIEKMKKEEEVATKEEAKRVEQEEQETTTLVKVKKEQEEEEESREAYMNRLKDLQQRIMTLEDNDELQKVVELIAKTGKYEVSARTFDFDLCLLERSTIRKLQEFFDL